jgi:hypothetical protein
MQVAHGNFLRELALPARDVGAETPATPSTPLLRRPLTWAIPAVLAAGATAYLFVDARLAKGRLDDIIATSPMFFFDEAEAERSRWRRSTVLAWVGVGVTLGLSATAIVMAQTRPSPVRVTPSVGADHAAVQLEANF